MVTRSLNKYFLTYRLLSRQNSGAGHDERCIYPQSDPGIVNPMQHPQPAFRLLLRVIM
jgi:hypothetical protein